MRPRDLVDSGDDPMVGRTLEGRYTILAKLGAGSMGTVYRAKQHAMGREVAIKILRGDRAVDDSAKARFEREARANSLLASPNTVTVFDFGESSSGEFYLAMELLEGESLGQRLTRVGKISPAQAVDAARQALRSLSEAHAKGIIHRDLKPDNLFFARVLTGSMRPPSNEGPDGARGTAIEAHDEIVKVLDFGIAKMVRDDDQPVSVIETQAGTVFGTPRYMSPEQAQGKPLDARSDLYSLGVILYQMLTGRPPFTDNDAVVVMARHIKSIPKRPNEANPEANIPKELEDVVMRALAKSADDRPGSAEIMAGELLAALEAQGALASGVRASITNAAGIRVPESMRPAAVPLPSSKKKFPIVAVAAPLALVLAAFAVYVGLSHRRDDALPGAGPATTTATIRPNGATATPTTAKEQEPPTVSLDQLPAAAAPGASGSSKTPHGKIPPGKPSGKAITPPKPPSQPGQAGTPASAQPGYGIFEN